MISGMRIKFSFIFFIVNLITMFCVFSNVNSAPPTISLVSSGKETNLPHIKDYLRELEKAVSIACPGEWQTGYKIIAVLPENKTSMENAKIQDFGFETRILLSGKHFKQIPSPKETEFIIPILFEKKFAMQKKNMEKVKLPDWILCALTYKIHRKLSVKNSVLQKEYPVLSNLARKGNIPSLKAMIENTIMPRNGFSWLLCGESCEIIFDALPALNQNSAEPILEQIILLSTEAEVGPYTAFSMPLSRYIEPKVANFAFSDFDIRESSAPEDKFQLWFRYIVMKKVLNIFNPVYPFFTKSLAEKTLKVSCEIRKPGTEEYENAELQLNTIDSIENIKKLELLLARQEKYFSEIMFVSNSELTPKLRAIASTFSVLRKGRIENFKKEFEKAWQAFEQEVSRLEQVEAWISEIDNTATNPAQVFSTYKAAVKEFNMRNSQAWPELEKFLEEQEQSIK
ncbi:MAG: hypothetical protein QXH80_03865 [Candidatus Nanoarchaeia archaeon]